MTRRLTLVVSIILAAHAHAHDGAPLVPVMSKAEIDKMMKTIADLPTKKTYCGGRDAKVFDVHMHSLETITDGFLPEQIVAVLKKAGVYRALTSSAPNENTFKLYKHDPMLFVPEIMPYAGVPLDKKNWFNDQNILSMIENFLKKGDYPFAGIGEFHLQFNEFVETKGVRQVVKLASEYGVFIHAHTGAIAVEKLLTIDPKVQVLWAHAGQGNADRDPIASDVEYLLKKYPNLWVEVAFNHQVAPDGIFDAKWKALLAKYSDRMMVGTDPFVLERWQNYPKIIDVLRDWLCELPEPVAMNLAFKTAEKLIGKAKNPSHK